MIPTPEQEALVKEEKLGVLATQKKDGSSQLSPVYYVYQEGRIVVSITKTRAKYHNIRRNSKVSICIMKPEGRPYVTVYGRAEIEEQDIVDGTAAVFKRFNDRALPENFEAGLREQQRVLVLITPEKFVP
ncbi:MAG: PPOX class F420-dependent oxidoreductase [Chloroflexi bacterium]|nr:PPOX class F420-dependent oxidoreductase [Chloroflexota bacterium]MCI0855633.1 PPOX class F420-dependent oxidoreductase [Chloroflexota bacterium]MCI0889405.1 PPOX class F420-dependent oxidoreductase [Chloroflexota bacterium]